MSEHTDQDRPCPHEDFAAFVTVERLTASDADPTVIGYAASIRIDCAQCGEAMRFMGLPLGVLPNQPPTNVTADELRAPIRPVSIEDPDFGMGLVGFTINVGNE